MTLPQPDKLVTLRAEVQKGFDDLDAGRYTEINSDQELHAHFAELSAAPHNRSLGDSDDRLLGVDPDTDWA